MGPIQRGLRVGGPSRGFGLFGNPPPEFFSGTYAEFLKYQWIPELIIGILLVQFG